MLKERIIEVLKTVYDPEIPVNVYDLGLIYKVELDEENNAVIDMTLTAPGCSLADFIVDLRHPVLVNLQIRQNLNPRHQRRLNRLR